MRSGYLKGIIGLPANLFYGTGIPACILVLDKENAPARKGIFMIDASKGFIKDGNKNRLREQDIHKIVDTFNKQADTPRYARVVPFEEIADPKNDYNLNLPRYIDSTEPEDLQDIDGHLRGGIPDRDIDALDAYWQVIPGIRDALFQSAGRPGYCQLRLPIPEVKPAILSHSEFSAFKISVTGIFEQWRSTNTPILNGFDKEGHPKELIETIAEDLLTTFRKARLIDAYDVYQHLMDYWAETMQDDCYLIAADGWVAKAHRVMEEVKSGKKKGEMKDKGWACDLIPKPYIVARYFAKEQAELDALQAELDGVTASLEELREEHGGEEGALKGVSTKDDALEAYTQALVALWNEEDKAASEQYTALMEAAVEHAAQLRVLTDHHHISVLKNTKGTLTLKAVKDRLAKTSNQDEKATLTSYLETDAAQKAEAKKAAELLATIKKQYKKRLKVTPLPENLTDLHATVRYLELLEEQSGLKSKVKEADAALDKKAYEKYPRLSVKEIKTLVVDDKWLAALATAVQGELDRVSQTLTGRIRQLAERYVTPLPQLVNDVAKLSARVDEHLKQAAMQRLLTGETRLPGFCDEWKEKTLGDVISKIVGGGTPSRANPSFWGNEIPWMTVKDFATFNPHQTQESITRVGLKSSASNLIPAGTLITSTRMALGKAVIYDVDVAINQDLKAIFWKSNIAIPFMGYWFEYHGRMIEELGSGSTVKGISIGELKRITFTAPSLSEQTAISAVLSDMDAEIAALEQRRDKTKDLKQAVMQELLTGKTRLV